MSRSTRVAFWVGALTVGPFVLAIGCGGGGPAGTSGTGTGGNATGVLPSYSVTQLFPPNQGKAWAISANGLYYLISVSKAVGSTANTGMYLCTAGGQVDLISAAALAVNNSGQFIGWGAGGDATLFGPNTVDLGLFSTVQGMNNVGQVVGSTNLPGQEGQFWEHAFLYRNGAKADLGTLAGYEGSSVAYAVNDSDLVVGKSDVTPDGGATVAQHACEWLNGTLTDLGTLGGRNSVAVAVNYSGQVAGNADVGWGPTHAFLYSNGAMRDLGTLGPYILWVRALNASGQVVGTTETSGALTHGFISMGGRLVDLNTLLGTNAKGWTITEANGISDSGEIIGLGVIGGPIFGQSFPVMLKPG
jgi:probable HAF family extracellular repeat protein